MNLKIISGGQTGVDQVALEIAKRHGIATGGWMPHGWRTDEGPRPDFEALYGMREHPMPGYFARTWANVFDADLTIWIGSASPGRTCTYNACDRYHRPWLENETVDEIALRIAVTTPWRGTTLVVNVAGNRLRTHPESSERARKILLEVISRLRAG